MKNNLQELCDAVLSALLNGGYQGILIAACVFIAFKCLPRLNAATRHAVSFVALLTIFLLPFAHFAETTFQKQTSVFSNESAHLEEASTSQPVYEEPQTFKTPAATDIQEEILASAAELSPPFQTPLLELAEDSSPIPSVPSPLTTFSPENESPALIAEKNQPESSFPFPAAIASLSFTRELSLPQLTSVIVLAFLLALAITRLAMLLLQFLLLHSWRKSASPPPTDLLNRFSQLRAESDPTNISKLLISTKVPSPLVAGYFRPVVLLPAKVCAESARDHLDQIIRHELAHLSRGDHWLNLAQQIISCLYFFHPGIWWLSRRLSVDREIACDDYVLARSGKPRSYALLLAEFASRPRTRPELTAAPAAWSKKSQLKERIDMILDPKRNSSPRLARAKAGVLSAAAICLGLAAMQVAPRVAVAQTAEPTAGSTLAETTETATAEISIDGQTAVDLKIDPPTLAIASVESTSSVEAADEEEGVISRVKPAPAPWPKPAPAPAPVVAPVQPVPPGAAPAPLPAHPRVEVVAPGTTIVASAGTPPHKAARARSIVSARGREGDLEKRLERLERMVEELLNQQRHPGSTDFHGSHQAPTAEDPFRLTEKEIERIHREAQRAAAQAAKEGEKARRETEKAMDKVSRDSDVHFDKKHLEIARQQLLATRQRNVAQRKQLETQRQALENHLRKVERQIEKFERDEQKFDELHTAEEKEMDTKIKRRENSDSNDNSSENSDQ